jgi:hypothetical protein
MYRHLLEKLVRTPLDDVIVSEGVLDRRGLEGAQAEQDQSGKLLSDVLLDAETIDEWDLAKIVARKYSLPFIDVRMCSIPGPVLELLPLDWCRTKSILPFEQFGKSIALACVEVPSSVVVDEIATRTGCTPFIYVTLRRSLRDAIDDQLKRGPRVHKSVPSVAGASAAAPAATPPGAAAAADGASAPAAEPAADVPGRKKRAVPADLPRVSLRLDATAAAVAQAKHTQARGATLAPQTGPVLLGASKTGPVLLGPAKAAPSVGGSTQTASVTDEAAQAGAPRKVSPIQHLLSQPDGTSPAGQPGEPQRPKLASRIAPVLPPAGPPKVKGGAAEARPNAPAGQTPPAPAQKSGREKAAWESIFDSGDQAVRKPTL